jgi:hypothetical protein
VTLEELIVTSLSISPWPDPIIDTLGHDPRSDYVERFWLPTLGPTSLLLLRRLASHFDREPDGCTLDVADLSQSLGLGAREGTSSPLFRSLDRLTQFELACSPRTRARRLAFMLFEQGDDLGQVEHALLGIGFHPTICRESAEWAYERHRVAFEAIADAAVAEQDRDTAA